MSPVACRSPAEIHDDDLVGAHDMCNEALRATCNGQFLHTGPNAVRISNLRNKLEAHIADGTPWDGPVSAMFLAHHTIYR